MCLDSKKLDCFRTLLGAAAELEAADLGNELAPLGAAGRGGALFDSSTPPPVV